MSNTELALSFSALAVCILMIPMSVIVGLACRQQLKPPDMDPLPTPLEYNRVDYPTLEEAMEYRGYLEPTAPIAIISPLLIESSTIR